MLSAFSRCVQSLLRAGGGRCAAEAAAVTLCEGFCSLLSSVGALSTSAPRAEQRKRQKTRINISTSTHPEPHTAGKQAPKPASHSAIDGQELCGKGRSLGAGLKGIKVREGGRRTGIGEEEQVSFLPSFSSWVINTVSPCPDAVYLSSPRTFLPPPHVYM